MYNIHNSEYKAHNITRQEQRGFLSFVCYVFQIYDIKKYHLRKGVIFDKIYMNPKDWVRGFRNPS